MIDDNDDNDNDDDDNDEVYTVYLSVGPAENASAAEDRQALLETRGRRETRVKRQNRFYGQRSGDGPAAHLTSQNKFQARAYPVRFSSANMPR